jgi:hypothetical protein
MGPAVAGAGGVDVIPAPTLARHMCHHVTLRGHRAALYCITFDKSGAIIITGSDDHLVKVCVCVCVGGGRCAFDCSTNIILLQSSHPTARTVHTRKHMQKRFPPPIHTAPFLQPPLLSLQFWSARTGLLKASCRGHQMEISDLSVSCDNSMVASCSLDGSVRVWSLAVRGQRLCGEACSRDVVVGCWVCAPARSTRVPVSVVVALLTRLLWPLCCAVPHGGDPCLCA